MQRDDVAFETTRPVTGEGFFGRTDELQECLARVHYAQSTLIVGRSRIGKTSLLHELRRRLQLQNECRVISAEFWERFVPILVETAQAPIVTF